MIQLYCYWIFLFALEEGITSFHLFYFTILDIPNRIRLVIQYGLKLFFTQFGFEL